jgi:hypothetical protein
MTAPVIFGIIAAAAPVAVRLTLATGSFRKGRHDVGRRLLRPVHAIRYTEKEIRAVGFQIRVPELQLAQRDAVHVGDLAAVVAGLDRVVSDFCRFVSESAKEVSCSDRLKW